MTPKRDALQAQGPRKVGVMEACHPNFFRSAEVFEKTRTKFSSANKKIKNLRANASAPYTKISSDEPQKLVFI